jgi:hypothetical protein
VWRAFARTGLSLGASIGDLTLASERHEGAVRAEAHRYIEVQLEVALHNAAVCADQQQAMLELYPLANLAWHAELLDARDRSGLEDVTAERVRELYPRLFERGWETFVQERSPATLTWEALAPPGEHPIFAPDWEPRFPSRALDDRVYSLWSDTLDDLRGLIMPGADIG